MNRITIAISSCVIGLWGMLFASEVPTTAPTELPTTRQLVVTSGDANYSSVLVLPFAPSSGASEWIGHGIQEDLATDLVRQTRLAVLTPPDAPAVTDAAAAAKVGQDRHASLVIFGTYQVIEDQLRINGQMVETGQGKAIAALKATGAHRKLFDLEDSLANQTTAVLPKQLLKSSVMLGSQTPTYNSFYTTPGPNIYQQYQSPTILPPTTDVPDSTAQYPLYNQYLYPPYYPPSGYPYTYDPGLFFYQGFGHRDWHRDHDGDRDDRGYDHGHDRDHGGGSYHGGIGGHPSGNGHQQSTGHDGGRR